MNLKASNLFVFWLIILFCVNNLEFGFCHKCHFDKIASSYFCEIIPNSSSTEEKHHDGKTDTNIGRIRFNGTLNDVTHLTQSELTPICQRFNNLKRIDVYVLKSLDENLFHQCRNLKEIWITNSEIEEIPENLFFDNPQLTTIRLTGNDLKTLPENIFINQKALVRLHLEWNQISCLPSNTFKSLTNLLYLHLSGNKIESLNPKWFENLQSLNWLCLDNNLIKDLPKNVFAQLENLNSLKLNGNQLTTIHADSFGNVRNLRRINLQNNKINAIGETFIDNLAFDMLDMSQNVCIDEYFGETLDVKDIKEKLRNCFNNYQSREDQSKHKSKFLFLHNYCN